MESDEINKPNKPTCSTTKEQQWMGAEYTEKEEFLFADLIEKLFQPHDLLGDYNHAVETIEFIEQALQKANIKYNESPKFREKISRRFKSS